MLRRWTSSGRPRTEPGAIDLAADTVDGCISSRKDEARAVDYVHSDYETACLRTQRIWRWESLETIIADTMDPFLMSMVL